MPPDRDPLSVLIASGTDKGFDFIARLLLPPLFEPVVRARNAGEVKRLFKDCGFDPANTNAYIAMKSAPDLPRKNFTAMLRLDHNRAASQIAAKTGKAVADIEKLTVWGNHSPTMYADYRFATINGESVAKMINDQEWNANTFLPTVGKRGAAIIEARGLSSAASAANAAIDHMRDWALGTNGKWVTMGIPSDGQYGIPKDVMFGFPVTTENGEYKIVEGLEIDAFSQERIDKTLKELTDEQAGVAHLL